MEGDGRTYSYVASLTKVGVVDDWVQVMNVAKLVTVLYHAHTHMHTRVHTHAHTLVNLPI